MCFELDGAGFLDHVICVHYTNRTEEALLSNSIPQGMCKSGLCYLCSPDVRWLVFSSQPQHGSTACAAFTSVRSLYREQGML